MGRSKNSGVAAGKHEVVSGRDRLGLERTPLCDRTCAPWDGTPSKKVKSLQFPLAWVDVTGTEEVIVLLKRVVLAPGVTTPY